MTIQDKAISFEEMLAYSGYIFLYVCRTVYVAPDSGKERHSRNQGD